MISSNNLNVKFLISLVESSRWYRHANSDHELVTQTYLIHLLSFIFLLLNIQKNINNQMVYI
jgi:hypothetical protein